MGMVAFAVAAQEFGHNGNGFFENRNASTDAAMAAIPGKLILFIPGGPLSKLADPVATPYGWGLDDARTTDYFSTGGKDEDGASLQKWLDKEDLQPDYSYLQSCIDLSNAWPGEFAYIYRVNINIPVSHTLEIISTLHANTELRGVIMGSEVYGWLNFDFDAYKAKFLPICEALHSTFPDLKIGLCVAPNPDRSDHDRWNDAVCDFINSPEADNCGIAAVDGHLYVGEKNCPEVWNSMPPKRAITEAEDSELSAYFADAFECLTSTTSIADRVAGFREKYPGMEIWCAEGYTTNPSAYFGNTWVGAAAQFLFLIEGACDISGKQSAVTPDIYGDICRRNDFDLPVDPMLKRTGYWATILALEAAGSGAVELPNAGVSAGNYYFCTTSGFSSSFTAPAGYQIVEVRVRRLTGQYLYSSAGGTQYHGRGSVKSFEIDGIDEDVFSNTVIVPPNSFGWIEVITEEIPAPECYCTDPAALNFNQQVDCADLTPCNYPVAGCRKFWWQIWKPKCASTKADSSIFSRKNI